MNDADEQRVAWGYVRLSQSGRDTSIDEQKRAIREYAANADLDLVTTRNEGENTSGFDTDRDEYQLLREKLRAEEIDAVVVRDRARLSRDFDDRLELLLEFRRTDVEWHVVEAGGLIDVDDFQTAAMEAIHAMTDHMKKQLEIERARDAVEERMERGDDHGRARFGMVYDDDGRRQVPGEDFDVVLEILERRDDGESYASIADDVPVSQSTVHRICDREEWYRERASDADQDHVARASAED